MLYRTFTSDDELATDNMYNVKSGKHLALFLCIPALQAAKSFFSEGFTLSKFSFYIKIKSVKQNFSFYKGLKYMV